MTYQLVWMIYCERIIFDVYNILRKYLFLTTLRSFELFLKLTVILHICMAFSDLLDSVEAAF